MTCVEYTRRRRRRRRRQEEQESRTRAGIESGPMRAVAERSPRGQGNSSASPPGWVPSLFCYQTHSLFCCFAQQTTDRATGRPSELDTRQRGRRLPRFFLMLEKHVPHSQCRLVGKHIERAPGSLPAICGIQSPTRSRSPGARLVSERVPGKC